ncbi:MAG: alpha/beta fold hydrolase [Proteobacteria bacterium]|nr:alpha/beta fold hydrolase [Pseudomonadota bacterium]
MAQIGEGMEAWAAPGSGERGRVGLAIIHGISSNPLTTRPLAEALALHGFRIEVPRLPGHGTNWRDMAATRYADWRAAVEQAAHELAASCDQVLLVGQSLGGTLALDVGCGRLPGVVGVVAINAAVLDRAGLVARLAPLVARLVPAIPPRLAGLVRNDAARPGVDEQAYEWLPTRAAQSMLDELPRLRERLRQLELPLLLCCSQQDHVVPPENTPAIAGLVAGPAVIVPLRRSFHLALLDHDRALIEQHILGFADALRRGDAWPWALPLAVAEAAP